MNRPAIAIVGGGLAAVAAAETYRKEGGTASVTIYSDDSNLPIHRPPLSKEFLRGDSSLDKVLVHGEEFYQEHEIDVRLNRRVERIDPTRKQFQLSDNEMVGWDNLVLATGARPRRLQVPGSDLSGIFYLRSLRSAHDLQAASVNARTAVIIGAGFIGMEVAATLTQKGVSCTVLEMGSRVWPALVPPQTSDFIQRWFESKGVRFLFDTKVMSLEGERSVERVVLADGTSIAADIVVAGVGAALNTELAQDAGLAIDRGVVVDDLFRTSQPNIYAIGDVANFPDPIAGRIHLEHWDNALAQGRALGATLAGRPQPFRHVAYFFSDMFDLSLSMIGYPFGWEHVQVYGNPDKGKFTTVYVKDGTIRAALLINDDAEFDSWTERVGARAPFVHSNEYRVSPESPTSATSV